MPALGADRDGSKKWGFGGYLEARIWDGAGSPSGPGGYVVIFRFERLTRAEECDRLVQVFGPSDRIGLAAALERQFYTLHYRAQVLLAICGVMISASVVVTTGRTLRGSAAQYQYQNPALVVAGTLAVIAAAVLCGGVLGIRWVTAQPGPDLRGWLSATLAYRDSQTRYLRLGTVLILLSMLFFEIASAIALMQFKNTAP